MRVVVLGAGGFVGGWICEELATRTDGELVACVRKWASATRLARRGIEVVQAELGSPALLPLLGGADLVINPTTPAAGREAALAHWLYSACATAGAKRFVQLSSSVVYGDALGEVSEDTSPRPATPYAHGKMQMEAGLISAAAKGGPQLFILRPSIVYGPFGESWTVRYAQRIAAGKWRSLGPIGRGTCNLIYAHDLARACLAIATWDVPGRSHVLNINGPETVTWNEYIERFGDALGISGRTNPNPAVFAAMALGSEGVRKCGAWAKAHFAAVVERMRSSAGTANFMFMGAKGLAHLYPTFSEMALLRRQVCYSWERARSLGLLPTTTLSEGLRQSAQWCHTHGII